jgi:secretion/DNA translocation related TadE-like protein
MAFVRGAPRALRTSAREGERGSISVVAAAVMAVLLTLALACADASKALMTASRAQAAADAAALAAAQSLVSPDGGDPESAAAAYAAANGATLVRCDCAAGGSEVTVEVRMPIGRTLLLPGGREVVRTARAIVGPSG